jgi:hypothetical protein
MKKLFFLMMAMLIVFSSINVFAQDENAGVNQDEMMKAWQESMTPGPMHEMLAHKVGEWKAEVTMWMDPNQPPSTSETKTVTESILGGRYFKSTHTGMMMGMPFEGYEINGYDNVKKKFFSIWLDNMGTGFMTSEGNYDEASKTINLTGQMIEPTGNNVDVREITKLIDNDNSTFEMYVNMGGKEMKTMEIKYTRVK